MGGRATMHYLIDGYNLLYAMGVIHGRLGPAGLEKARLRLLGGILVHDLRMARSTGLDRPDFLYVPSAVIYHDKEQLLDGKLSIRKVELTRPLVLVDRVAERRADAK